MDCDKFILLEKKNDENEIKLCIYFNNEDLFHYTNKMKKNNLYYVYSQYSGYKSGYNKENELYTALYKRERVSAKKVNEFTLYKSEERNLSLTFNNNCIRCRLRDRIDTDIFLPMPLLYEKNGVFETSYSNNDFNVIDRAFHNLLQEKKEFYDPKDISDDDLTTFVGDIDEDSPDRYKEFKEQYNNIEALKTYREEVFDTPITLAEKAFNKITNDTIDEKIILDIGNAGDRIEVKKQGDNFDIDYYDGNNNPAMQGKFTLLRDKQGNPLKEDKNGKILASDDINYNNQGNKLCFNMELETYYSDTPTISKYFKRDVNLNSKKERHNITLIPHDVRGNKMSDELKGIKLPEEPYNLLKRRMCKVHYDTYKTDLKAAYKEMIEQEIDPADLNIQFNA